MNTKHDTTDKKMIQETHANSAGEMIQVIQVTTLEVTVQIMDSDTTTEQKCNKRLCRMRMLSRGTGEREGELQ